MAIYGNVAESGRRLLACGVVGLTVLAASAGEASAQGGVYPSTVPQVRTQAEAELASLIARLQYLTALRRAEELQRQRRAEEDARYHQKKRLDKFYADK